jgi:hypothetical protein
MSFDILGINNITNLKSRSIENYNILLLINSITEYNSDEEYDPRITMKTIVNCRNKIRGIENKPIMFVSKIKNEWTNEEEKAEVFLKIKQEKEKWERYHSPKIHNCEIIFKPYIMKSPCYSTTSLWLFRKKQFNDDLTQYNLYQQEIINPIKQEIKDGPRPEGADHIDSPLMVGIYLDSKKDKSCNCCLVLERNCISKERELQVLRKQIAQLEQENIKFKNTISNIKSICELK